MVGIHPGFSWALALQPWIICMWTRDEKLLALFLAICLMTFSLQHRLDVLCTLSRHLPLLIGPCQNFEGRARLANRGCYRLVIFSKAEQTNSALLCQEYLEGMLHGFHQGRCPVVMSNCPCNALSWVLGCHGLALVLDL